MSQRERWVIYPLLFFCFAMCIQLYWRTDYGAITVKSLSTRQLSIEHEDGRQALFAGVRNNGAGYLVVYAPPPRNAQGVAQLEVVRLDVSGEGSGIVETLSNIGQRTVQLSSDSQGGRLVLLDPTGQSAVVTRAATQPLPLSENPRSAPARPPVPLPDPAPTSAVGNDAS